MALQDNGRDYHILTSAAKKIKGTKGLTCEVGLREGGGSKYIIDALIDNGDTGRTHIAIDPYGSIPYVQSENNKALVHGEKNGPYPNSMMKRCLSELYGYIGNKDIEILFFPLEDTEFFDKFYDGVPVYQHGEKEIVNTYALTYLDGPHDLESTMRETVFFADRGVPGSILVYDDIANYYDHSKIKEYLLAINWKILEEADSKNSYVKV